MTLDLPLPQWRMAAKKASKKEAPCQPKEKVPICGKALTENIFSFGWVNFKEDMRNVR